jgi:hypothetical protein
VRAAAPEAVTRQYDKLSNDTNLRGKPMSQRVRLSAGLGGGFCKDACDRLYSKGVAKEPDKTSLLCMGTSLVKMVKNNKPRHVCLFFTGDQLKDQPLCKEASHGKACKYASLGSWVAKQS